MKPSSFFRILFTLSLCFFALSCQKDVELIPVLNPESSTTISFRQESKGDEVTSVNDKNVGGINDNDNLQQVQSPMDITWTAKIIARRTDRNLTEYCKVVFRENPKCQMILSDKEHQFNFGSAKMLESNITTLKGTLCPRCPPNGVIMMIRQNLDNNGEPPAPQTIIGWLCSYLRWDCC